MSQTLQQMPMTDELDAEVDVLLEWLFGKK